MKYSVTIGWAQPWGQLTTEVEVDVDLEDVDTIEEMTARDARAEAIAGQLALAKVKQLHEEWIAAATPVTDEVREQLPENSKDITHIPTKPYPFRWQPDAFWLVDQETERQALYITGAEEKPSDAEFLETRETIREAFRGFQGAPKKLQ